MSRSYSLFYVEDMVKAYLQGYSDHGIVAGKPIGPGARTQFRAWVLKEYGVEITPESMSQYIDQFNESLPKGEYPLTASNACAIITVRPGNDARRN